MTAHTAGEWRDTKRPRHYGSAAIVADGPILIATVQVRENDPEGEANVRLVENAPNTLESLRELVAATAQINDTQHAGQAVRAEQWSELYQLTNKGRAIFEKVRGD